MIEKGSRSLTVTSATEPHNQLTKANKTCNDIHVVFSKLMTLCLSPSQPSSVPCGPLDIPGIFHRAGLRARPISQTRKSRLTPNPKPQTRTSWKRPLLIDSPGPSCYLWSLHAAGTVTQQDFSLQPRSEEEVVSFGIQHQGPKLSYRLMTIKTS